MHNIVADVVVRARVDAHAALHRCECGSEHTQGLVAVVGVRSPLPLAQGHIGTMVLRSTPPLPDAVHAASQPARGSGIVCAQTKERRS